MGGYFHLTEDSVDNTLRVAATVSLDHLFVRLNLRFRRDGVEDEAVEAVLADGGSIVLPGWTELVETRQEYDIPVLSKIPYADRLFTNVGYSRETERPFLILTPHVIKEKNMVGRE